MTTEVKQLLPPTSPFPLIFSFIYFLSINHHYISTVFCFTTTTANTFLLYFPHHHHHISIVFVHHHHHHSSYSVYPPPPPPPPPPHHHHHHQKHLYRFFKKNFVISRNLFLNQLINVEVNLSRKPLRILKEVA